MAIKESPTNIRTYYKHFIDRKKKELNDLIKHKDELEEAIDAQHNVISSWKNVYKTEFNIDLDKYKEFVNNEYIDGKFFRLAKGLFINKNNNYELVTDLFNLYDLASKQKELHDTIDNIKFHQKLIGINVKQYTEILKTYYTEVHKKLVLEGCGYSFTNGIGWICVNRCIFKRKHPMLDYAATKKKEKELVEKGERIYNKEEADWCARNGIEYNGKDKRVFVTKEYCYQIPLIDCKLPGGDKLKLQISDYRHVMFRGKTNDDIIEFANNDTRKICELPIDLKTKVTLCDKVDKLLYTKFIRNENQEPITFATPSRKDR